jgi:hypothetical protein
MVFRLIRREQNIATIVLGRIRGCTPKRLDLHPDGGVIGFGLDGPDIHAGSLCYVSCLSGSVDAQTAASRPPSPFIESSRSYLQTILICTIVAASMTDTSGPDSGAPSHSQPPIGQ